MDLRNRRLLGIDMTATFSSPQAAAAAGITFTQVVHWDKIGFISPSVQPAYGSGTRRVYSYADVVLLAATKTLLNAGMSFDAARRAVEKKKCVIGNPGSKKLVWQSGDVGVSLNLQNVRQKVAERTAAGNGKADDR